MTRVIVLVNRTRMNLECKLLFEKKNHLQFHENEQRRVNVDIRRTWEGHCLLTCHDLRQLEIRWSSVSEDVSGPLLLGATFFYRIRGRLAVRRPIAIGDEKCVPGHRPARNSKGLDPDTRPVCNFQLVNVAILFCLLARREQIDSTLLQVK